MKKFFLLAAAVCTAIAANADWYVVGSNVNGVEWNPSAPEGLMTTLGDGVYEWKGEVLGASFKITQGTWDDPATEICSNGEEIELGEPYYFMYKAEGGEANGNIVIPDCTELVNPVLTLNENDGTITLTGTKEGTVQWYLCGTMNNWANGSEEALMTEVDGKLVIKNVVLAGEGVFKIATSGYSNEFGHGEDPEGELPTLETITEGSMGGTLYQKGGDQAYNLTGTYDVEFTIAEDGTTGLVLFVEAGEGGVEGVELENAPVVYYNLQGVRVENPVSGVYVKVVGEKALKVLVAE